MSASRRVQRIEKEWQQIIAEYLLNGFKEPLPALMSVTGVRATGDLRSARVRLQVIGDSEQGPTCLKLVQDRAGDFQKELGRRLRTRYCPKLKFELDTSAEKLMEIERRLHALSQQEIGESE